MKVNEFYSKYSNTPLSDRFVKISFNSLNMTLAEIYKRLNILEDQIRPQQIEIQHLLMEADLFFNQLKLKGEK